MRPDQIEKAVDAICALANISGFDPIGVLEALRGPIFSDSWADEIEQELK